ncbi:MAG: hypothetical protein H7Z42_05885, partial [Roseiflexaceae bacterium]|nr:hypothetical protein [Roseiflexaceae bacterium]
SEVIVDTAGVPFSRYSGTITIVTAQGELSGRVKGQVRLTDGQLSSVVVFTRGTRGLHATRGILSVSGTINLATGAELDTYTGVLVR